MNNFEYIKNMTLEEMAEFLETILSDEKDHIVGCYDCINYNTHHYLEDECDGCCQHEIGLNIGKWLNKDIS